jgi:DNA mismatch repair protein MutL
MNCKNEIQILPEFIANQIAAGEVVQRPESVIKELVENSIDANATSIAIFINDAGKSLIHIVDNGVGMSKENLALAPLRHATSKIHSAKDLEEIKTFGFRGEALPSISSVALLEIRTKQKGDEHGWKLISEPQKEFEIEPIATEIGTQIFVKNLFYNVPARRKFLKANPTEQKYIYETVQKFAISNPDKRFIFYDNDSLIFDVRPETLNERIKSVLKINNKNSNDEQLLEVSFEMNDIKVSGFVGQPQLARKASPIQYLFLNGRSINSKHLSYAVYSAFEHLIEKNLKPFFVLNINLDYKTVDVNVHPQKSEVKFEDEKLVYSCVRKAVQEALKLYNFVPDLVSKTPMNSISQEIINSGTNDEKDVILVDKKTGEIYKTQKAESNFFRNLNSEKYSSNDFKLNKSISAIYGNFNRDLDKTNTYKTSVYRAFESINTSENIENTIAKNTSESANSNINSSKLFDENFVSESQLNNLWQFHNKYIFLQTNLGLVAIDQHNAHERIIYERLINKAKTGDVAKQNLLFPVEIILNSSQIITVREIENELLQIGFEFDFERKNGNSNFTIFSQPSDLDFNSAESIFIEILDDYIHSEELKLMNKQEKIIATVACKSAIKAGNKLSQEEMKSIVINLFGCRMPHICPHGRAILFQFPLEEFDKKFGRNT